jgi:hypothetical protein
VPVEIPLTKGLIALVDDPDVASVQQYRWHAIKGDGTWYARRVVHRPDGHPTAQRLHTFLTGWPMVDHRNGDGLDNRRANLRPATIAQNHANMRKYGGSSDFKGVSLIRSTGNWRAAVAGKYVGSFADEIDAALAYDRAARLRFGEFAALNFPEPGERSALVD